MSTLTNATATTSTPEIAPPLAGPLIVSGSRAARRLSVAVALLLLVIYALLQNPYWVRFGDSELFISTARSLARGEGFRFNGQPLGIAPPGWPLVLAGALKLTTRLLWLKLIPMASVLGFLWLGYVLLRRFTTPLIAALCILTTARLAPVI